MKRHTFEIRSLGQQGDGIAEHDGTTIFVPRTLPGETVSAEIVDGQPVGIEIDTPSPDRVTPPCRHFDQCGGCTAQHMPEALYVDWKRDRLVQALAQAGIQTAVDPMVTCQPESRRRATFSARHDTGGVTFGFKRQRSRETIAIEHCPVLTPQMQAGLSTFRALTAVAVPAGRGCRLTILQTRSGFDLSFEGDFRIDDGARLALARKIAGGPVARVTVHGEIIAEQRAPWLQFGPVPVTIPPGGFVQAVRAAQDAMVDLVCSHMKGCKSVADLFCGSGTFALPLVQNSAVHGVEGEAKAVSALERAWRAMAPEAKLRALTVEQRDLYRRPFLAAELADHDGVVFDPPRAGADVIARQIGASKVAKVAAVSCNPETLARDLAILVDCGFTIDRTIPIDQFLWSPHVEAIALLSRPVKKAHRPSLSSM